MCWNVFTALHKLLNNQHPESTFTRSPLEMNQTWNEEGWSRDVGKWLQAVCTYRLMGWVGLRRGFKVGNTNLSTSDLSFCAGQGLTKWALCFSQLRGLKAMVVSNGHVIFCWSQSNFFNWSLSVITYHAHVFMLPCILIWNLTLFSTFRGIYSLAYTRKSHISLAVIGVLPIT